MSPNKKFQQGRARYFHVSAHIIRNPKRVIEEAMGKLSILPEYIVGPRETYFKRNNEAKRMRVSTCFHKGTKPFRLAEPLTRCTARTTP